jgi:hypothetical protein
MQIEMQHKLMVGEIIKHSATKLQRNIKIFIWRKKIKRLKTAFELYYLKSTTKFLSIFSNWLQFCASKQQIRWLKFLKYRSTRLRKIREKLALLTIKRAIKAKKFNITTGKDLYQRLNRKRKQLMSVKTNEFDETQSPTNAHSNFYQLLQEIEKEKAEAQAEELRKALLLTKISYNIKDTSDVNFIPLFGDKYFILRSSIHKSTTPNAEQQKFRNLSINTPPLAVHKRMFLTCEIPSKLMAYPRRDSYAKPRPLSSHSAKVSDDMNFLKPTEFFLRKKVVQAEPSLENNAVVKKARPPSRKLLRNTIASSAKIREKIAAEFATGEFKTMNRERKKTDEFWKSFDMKYVDKVMRY